MSFNGVMLTVFLTLKCVMYPCVSQSFDHFYFVEQWPGSYCDTKRACCPTTGKPATDFSIHGLWPNYNNGSFPSRTAISTTQRSQTLLVEYKRVGPQSPVQQVMALHFGGTNGQSMELAPRRYLASSQHQGKSEPPAIS